MVAGDRTLSRCPGRWADCLRTARLVRRRHLRRRALLRRRRREVPLDDHRDQRRHLHLRQPPGGHQVQPHTVHRGAAGHRDRCGSTPSRTRSSTRPATTSGVTAPTACSGSTAPRVPLPRYGHVVLRPSPMALTSQAGGRLPRERPLEPGGRHVRVRCTWSVAVTNRARPRARRRADRRHRVATRRLRGRPIGRPPGRGDPRPGQPLQRERDRAGIQSLAHGGVARGRRSPSVARSSGSRATVVPSSTTTPCAPGPAPPCPPSAACRSRATPK